MYDASQLLPWSDFARLLLHSRVQHLSDYVRALALARLGGGWIIDGDTIWLKRAPNLSVACPPGLGHWFASQHACRSLRSHDKAAILRHWRRHYLKEPLDFLHVALPMGAPAMSPVIESWLSVIETSLYVQRDGLDNYHVLIAGLQTIVSSHGLEHAIADVKVACPFHHVKAKVAHLPEKLHLFDMGLLGRAMCVNNIWQSSMHGDAHELGDQRAAPGSAWDVVTQAWKLVVTARPSRRMRL